MFRREALGLLQQLRRYPGSENAVVQEVCVGLSLMSTTPGV